MIEYSALGRPPHFFGKTLLTETGGALEEAGYHFQGYSLLTSHGVFRYCKYLHETLSVYVIFQLLSYPGGPSRFRIKLVRA